MEHFVIRAFFFFFFFVIKVSEHFFLRLYLFGSDLKFLMLVKWESARGPWGGQGGPPLICRRKKNKRERQKGKNLIKKPLKADIKVEKFLI